MVCTKFTLVPTLDSSLPTYWVVRMAARFICARGNWIRIEGSLGTCLRQKYKVRKDLCQWPDQPYLGMDINITDRLKES